MWIKQQDLATFTYKSPQVWKTLSKARLPLKNLQGNKESTFEDIMLIMAYSKQKDGFRIVPKRVKLSPLQA